MPHEILIITPPDNQGSCYFEGDSGRLPALEGGTWFCFDEPYAAGCADLNLHLGFTVEQVMAAPRE